MRPEEYSLCHIEMILLSENGSRELLKACKDLKAFLEQRNQNLHKFSVEKDIAKIKARLDELPKRKTVSMDAELQDTCILVDD